MAQPVIYFGFKGGVVRHCSKTIGQRPRGSTRRDPWRTVNGGK